MFGTSGDSDPTGSNVAGASIDTSGEGNFSVNAAKALALNRKTSDGTIVDFLKDGSNIGTIGTNGGRIFIGQGTVYLKYAGNEDSVYPADSNGDNRDDAIDLGKAAARFDDIYATNSTIQTSDRNEKQDIEALSEAEARVAVACKELFRKYRWKSAVEKKGDDARIHIGIIAQDLQSAFEAEGLDAGRYGMFISSTWWETKETYTDDDGVEQTRTNTYDTEEEAPEGANEITRMGIRYSELLAFIISAM